MRISNLNAVKPLRRLKITENLKINMHEILNMHENKRRGFPVNVKCCVPCPPTSSAY